MPESFVRWSRRRRCSAWRDHATKEKKCHPDSQGWSGSVVFGWYSASVPLGGNEPLTEYLPPACLRLRSERFIQLLLLLGRRPDGGLCATRDLRLPRKIQYMLHPVNKIH